MKTKLFLVGIFLCLISFTSSAQLKVDWQKTFGGSDTESASDVCQTNDNGYLVLGRADSADGDVSDNYGNQDYWLLKLTSTGEIEWKKSYGGTGGDYAMDIKQTSDDGFIVVGDSNSTDADVSENNGNYDFWIVKLNANGIIEWEKSLGGSEKDYGRSVQLAKDGGYIIAGYSFSNNGDVTENKGDADYWVVKLNTNGIIEWEKSLGGYKNDFARSIKLTNDGGYIVAGNTYSTDGDIIEKELDDSDYWIVKLNNLGLVEWSETYGGTGSDNPYSIEQTTNGSYLISGHSYSSDGNVTNNNGLSDAWFIKVNNTGSIEWEKSIGGLGLETIRKIQATNDGGYISVGRSSSNDGDFTENQGDYDFLVIKFSPTSLSNDDLLSSTKTVLFPNPTTGILNFDSSIDIKSIKIYNEIGQRVSIYHQKNSIDISNFKSGLYIVRIENNLGEVMFKKVIKQ